MIGANQTPFLNMIGGLQGGNVRLTSAFEFPIAQPWALEPAAQTVVTETASATAPTAWSYVRAQDTNTCQIMHRTVAVSYAKQSVTNAIVADTTTNLADAGSVQPVQNERDFQIAAAMSQLAVDVEFSFLRGTYAQVTSAASSGATRGIITAATTNTVNASAYLTRTNFNTLLRTMAANGARFTNSVIFVNGFQKQKLTEIFGYAPAQRNIGGVNINQIETDFALLGVVWAPYMPVGTLLVADLSVVTPVFCQVPGKGVMFYEELAKTGASERGQVYTQIGIDYGPEEFHGTITSLSYA